MTPPSERWVGIFRQANIADLLILSPFAIPVVADYYLGLWRWVSGLIAADSPLGEFGPDAILFVNLAGVFAALCVLMRSRLGSLEAARITGFFKLCAAGIFAIALARGASLVFAIPLIADCIVGGLLVGTTRRT